MKERQRAESDREVKERERGRERDREVKERERTRERHRG